MVLQLKHFLDFICYNSLSSEKKHTFHSILRHLSVVFGIYVEFKILLKYPLLITLLELLFNKYLFSQ